MIYSSLSVALLVAMGTLNGPCAIDAPLIGFFVTPIIRVLIFFAR
jgi:hypothetical protein